MIDPGLRGRVALITGGNNPFGIGAACARALAAQGVAVFIHYYRLVEPQSSVRVAGEEPADPGIPFYYAMQGRSGKEVARAIEQGGGRAAAWEADLGDPGRIAEMFDKAEEALGPVEILINNAADYQADTFVPRTSADAGGRPLWEEGPIPLPVTAQSHDRHFSVNTRAVALAMTEFAKRHVRDERRWGRIINVSADCSWGCPGEVSYRASKHALESYSRSAAAELGPLGITVNVLSPGPVQTGYISAEMEQQLGAEIPMRRVGQPEDVADAIVFLASDQARWITGQLLTVHGGHRLSLGR